MTYEKQKTGEMTSTTSTSTSFKTGKGERGGGGGGGRGRGGHFAKSLAVFVPTVKQNVSTNHRESPRISQWPQHPQASPKEMGACGFLTGQRVTRRVQEEEVEEVEGGGGGGGGGVQHRGQPKVWSWADDEQTTRPLKPLRTESSGW